MNPRRLHRTLAVLALGAVLGSSVACSTDDDAAAPPTGGNATPIPAAQGVNDALPAPAPTTPQTPAPTPAAAVQTYLDAEIAGAFDASYAVLSADDRDDIGSAQAWRDQHSAIPRPTFYSFMPEDDGDVTTEVRFEPRVDETAGVVAGSARIVWATVEEGGGFVVDRTGTTTEPRYPDAALASADVMSWIRARRAGDPPEGYVGSLVGQPDLVSRIESSKGGFTADETIELDDWSSPEIVTNAFGPDASRWAQVVRVDGPVPFDAVTAPFGDRWVVVGLVGT